MTPATAADLLRFAATLEGERIPTLAGRAAFRLRVLPGGIEFTPESSGKPRLVSHDMVDRVLSEYDATRSRSPGEYQSITFDASYLLAIIDRFNGQQGQQ